MNICYLTPSGRTDKIPPPLVRVKKRPDTDGRSTISAFEYSRLPASEKAGFLLAHEKGFYIRKWSPSDTRRETAHRLVEASKSPTRENDAIELEISKQKFLKKYAFDVKKYESVNAKTGEVSEFGREAIDLDIGKQITPHGVAGCSTVIQFREWADEWRVRTQVEATSGSLPPAQEGARISEMLSQRGAKKIAEACEFMSLKKGGFKTFVTGTFNEATRKKIELGETTIQREVSRCMDALQKMYQRGWQTQAGESVPGCGEGLSYCWVVEIPYNENGEPNPHVHMLLGWSVPYRLFADWSQRIERIWGNGYFHLEKIKDCACAGAYMAKAAGYLTKSEGTDTQGRVRGNRYGISESARAPDWVTIGKSQLHAMGQIIADVYDHLTIKYGAQYRERKQLKETLDRTPKENKWSREQIGKRLQEVREQLKTLPIRCNKYQVILKGREAASAFICWAKGEKIQRDWLPELPVELAWQEGRMPTAADSQYFRKLREKFQWLKRKRHSFTDEMCAFFVDQWERFKDEAFSGWSEYESLDLCQ